MVVGGARGVVVLVRGGTHSPPDSPIHLGLPHEDEDHNTPPPDARGMLYQVHRGGLLDLGNSQARYFRLYLNNLIHSTYLDCFERWSNNDPELLNYVESCLHLQYPNPENHKFSRQWLESHVKTFLRNKRSSVRRAARRQRESPKHNHRPGQVHDIEWQKAMAELLEEDAAGVGRRYAQQMDARARQTPTHYGSGGKATWKDKYVSIYLFRYLFSINPQQLVCLKLIILLSCVSTT